MKGNHNYQYFMKTRKLIKTICALGAGLFLSFSALGMEHTFYILRNETLDNLTALSKINILIPQAYVLNQNGIMAGFVAPQLLLAAKKSGFKIMPLVTNENFDYLRFHQFLHNTQAQRIALRFMLNACQQNHFYGLQLDFENVHMSDRKALTHFYQLAATTLHKQGFAISFTIVPLTSNQPPASNYLRARFNNWSGAYDYVMMGKISNFVTLMAYDQHTGDTPGPVAGYSWDEQIIRYARQYIPANKIYLGIPTYSGFYFTESNGRTSSALAQISYATAMNLIALHHAQLFWDSQDQVNYTFYTNNDLYEYIFLENVNSFQAKYDLAKRYGLGGISVWRIGTEDPKIWNVLPK